MDITSTITARCRVSATWDADTQDLSITVFAQGEYAPGRTATAQLTTKEIPPMLRDGLRDVLIAIYLGAEKELGTRLPLAIHRSAEAAMRMGEL